MSFPTNLELANILGRMVLDVENFIYFSYVLAVRLWEVLEVFGRLWDGLEGFGRLCRLCGFF